MKQVDISASMFFCAAHCVVGPAHCLLSKNADVVFAIRSVFLSSPKQIGFRVPYGFLGIICTTKNKYASISSHGDMSNHLCLHCEACFALMAKNFALMTKNLRDVVRCPAIVMRPDRWLKPPKTFVFSSTFLFLAFSPSRFLIFLFRARVFTTLSYFVDVII
jgi:hypothetical protein